jgi:hypothetical protein
MGEQTKIAWCDHTFNPINVHRALAYEGISKWEKQQ